MTITRKIVLFSTFAAAVVVGAGAASFYGLFLFCGHDRHLTIEEAIKRAPVEFGLVGAGSVAGALAVIIAGASLSQATHRRIKRLTTGADGSMNAAGDEFDGLIQKLNEQTATIVALRARQTSEEQLLAAQRFADNVIQSMFDLLIVTNSDLRIVTVNRATCDVLGYSQLELLGRPVEELFQEQSSMERPVRQRLLDNDARDMEMVYRTSNGRLVSALVSASVMRDTAGQPHGVILVGKDITARKQIEQDLMEAKVAAEGANRAKSAFLANMSHEIRTPMTAILGYADLLAASSEDDRRRHVETIRRNGQHLLSIINDILDVSKIEAGKMTVEKIACSPAQVVTDACGLMAVRAADKKLNFSVRYTSPIPETITSDPTRLRQILVNLLGNAIKFTSKGTISLMAGMDQADPMSAARLRFDVVDSGPGMSPQQLEMLFRPFVQADSSTTRKYGGTGLGLMISKRLAEMLGGDIVVHSEQGQGSTFSVFVKTGDLKNVKMIDAVPPQVSLASSQSQAATPAAAPKQLEGRILLAEDGPDNQQLIEFYLKEFGLDVTVVGNGALARDEVLAAGKKGLPFDLVLMDMQMPELDGYGATQQLRAAGYRRPILALTAHAMDSDRDKCIAAGCNDFVGKPIDHAALQKALAKYLPEALPVPAFDDSQPQSVAPGASHNPDMLKDLLSRPKTAQLVDRFVRGLDERLAAFREATQENDAKQLNVLAHQLKGAAGGYGFPGISLVAKTLETASQIEPPDFAAVQAAVQELARLCDDAKQRVPVVRSVEPVSN